MFRTEIIVVVGFIWVCAGLCVGNCPSRPWVALGLKNGPIGVHLNL